MDQLRVLCECADPGLSEDDRKGAARAFAERVKQTIGISILVDVAPVGSVARSEGKAVRIVDNRPRSGD